MDPTLFSEEDIKSFFTKDEKPAEEIKVEFSPAKKPSEQAEKKKFWGEDERYQTALKLQELHQDRLSIPKLILRFVGIFILIFGISYTIINSPALIKKMKFYWVYDIRNIPTPAEAKPVTQLTKDESRLIIPKIKVDAPIIWQVLEANIIGELQKGVVHYQGTALPGQPGNIFITGHSSYYIWAPGSYKDVFALLDKLTAGDKIYIQYDGATFSYRVSDQKVVSPNDLKVLAPTGKNILSLMTCVPIGTNLNRLIVTAQQVSE